METRRSVCGNSVRIVQRKIVSAAGRILVIVHFHTLKQHRLPKALLRPGSLAFPLKFLNHCIPQDRTVGSIEIVIATLFHYRVFARGPRDFQLRFQQRPGVLSQETAGLCPAGVPIRRLPVNYCDFTVFRRLQLYAQDFRRSPLKPPPIRQEILQVVHTELSRIGKHLRV